MIIVVSGKIGAGKSYDTVRTAIRHLRRGCAVRTNIHLDFKQIGRRIRRAIQPWQIGLVSPSDDPKLIPIGDRRGQGKRRTMVILDEALNWFQSTQDRSKGEEQKKELWGKWLRQSDKLGQDVYFIAQNFERSAKWIRELAQLSIEIVPFNEIRIFHFIRLSWVFPFASRMYARIVYDVRSKSKLRTTVHLRSSYVWDLYDTSETFGFDSANSVYDGHVMPPAFKTFAWLLLVPLLSTAISFGFIFFRGLFS